MQIPPSPVALIKHLRSLSDVQLSELLREHWLICQPPLPTSFEELAAELVRRIVRDHRSTVELNRFEEELCDALLILGANPISIGDLHRRLGPDSDPEALTRAIDRFLTLGLVWGSNDALYYAEAYVNPEQANHKLAGLGAPIKKSLSAYPPDRLSMIAENLGLPKRDADLVESIAHIFADPGTVQQMIDNCSADQQRVLDRLANGGRPDLWLSPKHVRYGENELLEELGIADGWEVLRPLINGGLLVVVTELAPLDFDADRLHLQLPREVGMAIREASPFGTLHPNIPELEVVEVDQTEADAAGARQAWLAIAGMTRLLDHCAEDPPTNARWRWRPYQHEPTDHQGIDDDELDHLCAGVGLEEDMVVLLLEIAHWAGLLAMTPDEAIWLPTPEYETWRSAPAPKQWLTLADAWLHMDRLAAGRTSVEWNGFSSDVLANQPHGHPEERRRPLELLAGLGQGLTATPESIFRRLEWQRPGNLIGRHDKARWALAEAALLGLFGRSALTSYARTLLSGNLDLRALEGLLPTTMQVIVQPSPAMNSDIASLSNRRQRIVRRAPKHPHPEPVRTEPIYYPDASERALIVQALRHNDRWPNPPARESRKIAKLREAARDFDRYHPPLVIHFSDERGRSFQVAAAPLLVTRSVLLAREYIDDLTFTIPLKSVTNVVELTDKEGHEYSLFRDVPVRHRRDPRKPGHLMEFDIEADLERPYY